MDKMKMLLELCELSELRIPGGELTETRADGYTRTIKQPAAMAAAIDLLKAETAGKKVDRRTLDRAAAVIRLARWHKGEGV